MVRCEGKNAVALGALNYSPYDGVCTVTNCIDYY
jgi:hypothetical protein